MSNQNEKVDVLQIAQMMDERKKDLKEFAKGRIFDVIGIGLIIAMMVLVLGVFTGRDLTWEAIESILLEVVPFYFAALLLSTVYYKKGSFNGKLTNTYLTTISAFSTLVSKMTGPLLEYLPDFCEEYNEKTRQKKQREILKSEHVTLERFLNDKVDDYGNVIETALCKQKFFELRKKYGYHFAKTIYKAKYAKIKGISTNKLLGTLNVQDDTDLGPTETQMIKRRTVSYALRTILVIFFLTFVTVKSILEWGWISLLFMSFKIIYVAVNSYMKYFHGYDDVTIRLVNHFNRKGDILRQCIYSYELQVEKSASNVTDK